MKNWLVKQLLPKLLNALLPLLMDRLAPQVREEAQWAAQDYLDNN